MKDGAERDHAAVRQAEELRHRLRNHLQSMVSLINLQIRRAKHAETVHTLEDLQARFSVMSIHADLDGAHGAPMALDQCLARIAQGITALYDPMGRHTLSIELAPLALPGRRALVMGQILAELLILAYRQGGADRVGARLQVKLAAEGEDAILAVTDDGRAGREPSAGDLGISMTAGFVRAVRGAFEHDRRAGLVGRVRFPIQD